MVAILTLLDPGHIATKSSRFLRGLNSKNNNHSHTHKNVATKSAAENRGNHVVVMVEVMDSARESKEVDVFYLKFMSTTFSEYEDVSLPSHDAELHDNHVVLVAPPLEDEGDSVFPFLCSAVYLSLWPWKAGLVSSSL